MFDIPTLAEGEFLDILGRHDTKDYYERAPSIPAGTPLPGELQSYMEKCYKKDFAVLGIDIYRYSTYPPNKQALVPFLFRLLYSEAARFSREGNAYFFSSYPSDFRAFTIDTGDGCFQVFKTPLHALLFGLSFQLLIRAFNSYHFYPKLRSFLGELNLRYAITYNKLYKYEGNYFGPAIINNSRILSKDRLNRLIVDDSTHEWFLLNTNGLENLSEMSVQDLASVPDFADQNPSLSAKDTVFPPRRNDRDRSRIRSVQVQQIEEVQAKDQKLHLFNVHIQFTTMLTDENDPKKSGLFTISLGNLNPAGIE